MYTYNIYTVRKVFFIKRNMYTLDQREWSQINWFLNREIWKNINAECFKIALYQQFLLLYVSIEVLFIIIATGNEIFSF